jgi:hypothetical protein
MVAMGSLPRGGEGVDSDRALMLEDARSISQGLGRKARLAQDAAESLDGMVEAVEVREVLERLQALSIEVSEEVDAYQDRHGG